MSEISALKKPKILTIILNFKRPKDTLACLESLQKNNCKNDILVLDISSEPQIPQLFLDKYPDIQVKSLKNNGGYAGNNNVGIEIGINEGYDWLFLLNDDTILDNNCLSNLLNICNNDNAIGIAGPLVFHHSHPNVIQSAGGILGSFWQSQHLGKNQKWKNQYKTEFPVDWISGCALLIRRETVEQIGLLDEKFYLYWEEVDWCFRAKKAGWKVVAVPQAKIWHKGVQIDYNPNPLVTYYSSRNHLLFLSKHQAPLRVKFFTIFRMIQTLISWTIKPRWREKKEHRNAMWRGLIDYIKRRFGPMTI